MKVHKYKDYAEYRETQTKANHAKNCEIFPQLWKKQKTFQTECFVLWSDIAVKYKWWGEKGGDHHYTNQITRHHPIVWHDTIATQAQAGKGHGECADAGGQSVHPGSLTGKVHFKMFASIKGKKQCQLIEMPIAEAITLEKHKLGRVTFKDVSVEARI